MTNGTDVLAALENPAVQMNTDQISRAWALLKRRYSQESFKLAIGFNRGDRVEFDARGGVVTGNVEKSNTKTVSVKADDGRTWRVGASLLRKVAPTKIAGSGSGSW